MHICVYRQVYLDVLISPQGAFSIQQPQGISRGDIILRQIL